MIRVSARDMITEAGKPRASGDDPIIVRAPYHPDL